MKGGCNAAEKDLVSVSIVNFFDFFTLMKLCIISLNAQFAGIQIGTIYSDLSTIVSLWYPASALGQPQSEEDL